MGFFKKGDVFLPNFQLEIKDNNLSHNIKKIENFLGARNIFFEFPKKKIPKNTEKYGKNREKFGKIGEKWGMMGECHS